MSVLSAFDRDLGRAKKLIAQASDPDQALSRAKRFIQQLENLSDRIRAARDEIVVRIWQEENASLSEIARRAEISKSRAAQIIKSTARNKETYYMLEKATQPERPPVVAGIVTCERGVLVGKRIDGKPPWTFIAGEVKPGESPAEAIVREVKEEAGIRVVAAEREIGRRVHPKTGRTMIYVACSPTGKTDVVVGDPDELEEVKWISLSEVDTLLPGLFEPVRQYLIEQLGNSDNAH